MDKPQLSEIARVQDQHGKAPYQITFRDTRSLYQFSNNFGRQRN